jgi:hypothetical protein
MHRAKATKKNSESRPEPNQTNEPKAAEKRRKKLTNGTSLWAANIGAHSKERNPYIDPKNQKPQEKNNARRIYQKHDRCPKA